MTKETMRNEVIELPGYPSYWATREGAILRRVGDVSRIMRGSITRKGYRIVVIKRKAIKVSRLVLLAFVGPCPHGMEACHNNGIRTDDRLVNLRWDTRRNNHVDKKAHGTFQAGELHGMHKLTGDQVAEIRRAKASGKWHWGSEALARKYGVHRVTVSAIANSRWWKESQ